MTSERSGWVKSWLSRTLLTGESPALRSRGPSSNWESFTIAPCGRSRRISATRSRCFINSISASRSSSRFAKYPAASFVKFVCRNVPSTVVLTILSAMILPPSANFLFGERKGESPDRRSGRVTSNLDATQPSSGRRQSFFVWYASPKVSIRRVHRWPRLLQLHDRQCTRVDSGRIQRWGACVSSSVNRIARHAFGRCDRPEQILARGIHDNLNGRLRVQGVQQC